MVFFCGDVQIMTEYKLLIADPSYSSWSLRGWLCFAAFGISVSVSVTRLYTDNFLTDVTAFSRHARTVPVASANDGSQFTDSLTIAEELAHRHPEACLLPSGLQQRATARALMAEMHSSFTSLRADCPMNTRTAYAKTPVSEAVEADLRRLEELWQARKSTWLFGEHYSVADAFFAPVAARIAGYNLPVSEQARAYVSAHLHHLPFRQFRAWGQTFASQSFYFRDYAIAKWPGPAPLEARAVDADAAESVNKNCPYSGNPVTDFLEMSGRIYGFCNPRCRDKTVLDPSAWPAFMTLAAA